PSDLRILPSCPTRRSTGLDPDRWLRAAADAGMTYAVLTAMHHDGYTLWPSRYSQIGVRSHMAGRDLVGPFVEACRKYGLKVGLRSEEHTSELQSREYIVFR